MAKLFLIFLAISAQFGHICKLLFGNCIYAQTFSEGRRTLERMITATPRVCEHSGQYHCREHSILHSSLYTILLVDCRGPVIESCIKCSSVCTG